MGRMRYHGQLKEAEPMGHMRHHAIIVTSWNSEKIEAARAAAVGIFGPGQVSEVLPPVTNNYRSFFVGPDGSKEGWSESDEGDAQRDAFVAWLNEQRTDDGGSYHKWAEVVFADDGDDRGIVRDEASTRPDGCEIGGPVPVELLVHA